jgi:Family of unknown function (DUF5683)
MFRLAFIIVCIIFPGLAFAQETEVQKDTTTTLLSDSVRIDKGKDVIDIESYAKRYNPRKALLYSAIMPGMGQVYNKKYWKLPLVYGGFGVGYYFIKTYQEGYLRQREELFIILDKKANPSAYPSTGTGSATNLTSSQGLTEAGVRTYINKYRRERDYWVLLTGIWYALQLIDAHVDAHLKEFDLNPQLKVSVEPMMENSMFAGRNAGVSLIIKF